VDKSLEKKTAAQSKKMAKAKGIKGYARGLVDVLGIDRRRQVVFCYRKARAMQSIVHAGKKPGGRCCFPHDEASQEGRV
jgi:hypothetical protein